MFNRVLKQTVHISQQLSHNSFNAIYMKVRKNFMFLYKLLWFELYYIKKLLFTVTDLWDSSECWTSSVIH